MSALAVLDSHTLLPDLVAQARLWPTDRLRAECRRGIASSAQSEFWPDTLTAMSQALREREEAEINLNGGESL